MSDRAFGWREGPHVIHECLYLCLFGICPPAVFFVAVFFSFFLPLLACFFCARGFRCIMRAYIRAYIHAFIHKFIHTCIRTYIHTYNIQRTYIRA